MRVIVKKHSSLDKWITLQVDDIEVRVDNDDVDPNHSAYVVKAIVAALKASTRKSFFDEEPAPREPEDGEDD